MLQLPRSVLPWLAGISVAGLLCGAWLALRQAESRALARSTSIVARQAAPRLADYVAARLTIVGSLARERAQHAQMTDADFKRRARILEGSFGGLLGINWIDNAGVIRIAVPEERNRSALGRNVRNHPEAAPFFARAARTGEPTLTGSLQLFQGPRGVASYFPVRREGRTLGFVNGVFDCSELVKRSLAEGILDSYLVRVSDETGRVYESRGYGTSGGPVAQAAAVVANQTWWVEVEPGAALREASHSHHVDLLIPLGLVLGLAVTGLTGGWLGRRRALDQLKREREALENQMIEAQKLEAIGRLAGGVAHDFNNLLTAMIGHAELAKRSKELPDRVRKDLDVIIEAARRGAEITRDLLAFSRKEIVHPRAMDVAEEVKRLVPMLEHLLREDVALELDVDPEAGRVLMDPTQLERALMNLVVNAVDAQPNGGLVTLSVQKHDDANIRVAVSDAGEGMSNDVAAHAFEPFYTTKPPGKGTGLGLASVYGIARQLGGDALLSTEEGHGTTVALVLPRTAEEGPRATSEPAPAPKSAKASVLLVEDDDALRHLARRVLSAEGYSVTAAANANEALMLVHEGLVPEILLTDEVMPGMRGHQLAVRLSHDLQGLRVLVCSGHADELVDESKLTRQGAAFLHKPYTPTELLAALGKVASARAGS